MTSLVARGETLHTLAESRSSAGGVSSENTKQSKFLVARRVFLRTRHLKENFKPFLSSQNFFLKMILTSSKREKHLAAHITENLVD